MITSKMIKNGRFYWAKFSYWISRISQTSRIWIFPRNWFLVQTRLSIFFSQIALDFFILRFWGRFSRIVDNLENGWSSSWPWETKREILNHLLVSHLVQVWWPSSLIFSSITTAQRWIGDRDHVNAFVRDIQGDHVIYKMWSRDG